jgi:RNA polymerase sigma-70 factor (ECF subfamily)
MPDDAEAWGLLALMLLHDARRAARVDSSGTWIQLDAQDSRLWDEEKLNEGITALQRGLRLRRPGPYQLQAAIAALHARAPRPEDTDWPQIAGLYGALAAATPNPVVELNRAVAVAMADGPAAGLPLLDALEGELDGYHLFHAARADLLRRLDRRPEAETSYRRALDLATNPAERAFLDRRLTQL